MRFRKIDKWDDVPGSENLLFFAQLVEEMLFDYSLDTYKPSVMHTGLLCSEALNTIREVKNGNIRVPNVWHVAAELYSSYQKDPVAQDLVSLSSSALASTLKNKTNSINDLQTVLELISIDLSPSKYKEKNETLLSAAIKQDASLPETRSTIRRLARNYITTLIAIGFHQKHIYQICLDFFFYGNNRISGLRAIDDFLALFHVNATKYTVIFRVSQVFDGLSKVFQALGLKITRSKPALFTKSPYPEFTKLGHGEFFVIANDIEARDVYSARESAEHRLKLISTLLSMYHHKAPASWHQECVVYFENKKIAKKLKTPINSMHKCSDLTQPIASKKLKQLLGNFSLEEKSFSKFIRSAQLHSMAISSDSKENQILNLWISLESLIPSESKKEDTCNIEHIVSSIVPFLNISYIQSLLENLVKDLLRWRSREIRPILKAVDGGGFVSRLAKILALEEHKSKRGQLADITSEFHLLHDRLVHFETILCSPRSVKEILDAHKLRLEWQIRRVYRVRNIIVHSGNTPWNTKPLIEHCHSYLDTILNELVRLASEPKSINSVVQGFKLTALRYDEYYRALSENKKEFNVGNIDRLLFPVG